jgi:hypothetical protein
MTSFLTGALGDYLGDAVAAAVGLEHTDAEFSKRAEAAFKHADADGSGALDFGETYAACVAVPGLKHLSEARAREIFRRFDEDGSGSLDVEEFKKLAALLRSAHALDQMPGVIYCGGRLMNPSKNPAVAQAARLKEIYSKPYVPRSVLAKAIAKSTVRRRVVYGGVDLENLEALTDDDETIEGNSHRRARSSETRGDAKKRRRRRSSRGDTGLSRFKKTSWSVGALETTYVCLVILRALCAVLGTGYIHPDEYHQTVEIGARDVLSVAASPRAWEFDSAAPTRSVAGHVLAAGASFRVWRFLARFDRNVVQVAKAMLAGAAGGCEKAALARGFAAGLRQLESRLFRDTMLGDDGFERAFVEDDAFSDTLHVSPLVIFLAPRVFAFCASLMVDLAASRAARAAYWAQSPKKSSASKARGARRGEAHQEKSFSGAARVSLHARLFVASAWPAVTLLVRPLTNAAECVLVSALLCLVCAPTITEGLDDDDEGVVFQSRDEPEKPEKVKKSRRARNSLTRAAFRAGAVTALGTWSRFTFPLFAAPLGALLVVRAARAESRLLSPYGQRVARARGALVAAAAGFAGFFVVALVMIVVDTAYFEGFEVTRRVFFGDACFSNETTDPGRTVLMAFMNVVMHRANDALLFARAWFRDPSPPPVDFFSVAWRETSAFVAATRSEAGRFLKRCAAAPWVVTPYNAFKYNASYDNLETHGIHPRLTHVIVNFPMLFGPLAFAAYKSWSRALAGFFSFSRAATDSKKEKKTNVDAVSCAVSSANATRVALLFALFVPLLCLSLAPHQEPRFLLPLLPAAAAAAAADGAAARFAASPATLAAWSATNALAAGFFGFAHQGGVVPAVAQMASILAEDDTAEHALVYFWRTYTPPESLLAFPAEPEPRNKPRLSADAFGKTNGSPSPSPSPYDAAHSRVGAISPSHVVDLQGASMDSVLAAFAANEDWSHFYVVAPATAAAELKERLKESAPGTAVTETWRRGGHFSGEEMRGYRDAFKRGGLRELWDAMSLGVYAVER